MCLISSLSAQEVFRKDAPKLQLNLKGVYEDNHVPLVEENLSAFGFVGQANGQLVADFDSVWLRVKYAAELSSFSFDASSDEIDDQFVIGQLGFSLRSYVAERWFIDLITRVHSEDERLGRGISRFRSGITESDHFNQIDLGLSATYGSDISNRYLQLSYLNSDKNYASNNVYSNEFDLKQQLLSGELGINIFGASRLLFVAEYEQDDYDSVLREDSNISRVFIGFDWRVSGKSRFSLLLGGYQREFDFGTERTGLSWRLSGVFEPTDYWTIRLSSAQESVAGDIENSLDTVQTDTSLSISRKFSDQWQAGLFASYQETDYELASDDSQMQDAEQSEWGSSIQLIQSSFSRFQLKLSSFQQDNPSRLIDFRQNQVSLNWQFDY